MALLGQVHRRLPPQPFKHSQLLVLLKPVTVTRVKLSQRTIFGPGTCIDFPARPDYFESPAEGFAEIWKCFEYFNDIWQERQAASTPGDDLISFLAHGEATKHMAPNEFLGNVLLLIVGGNDTTRNSISAGVQALNRFPEEYDKLKGNLNLIPNMVSEIVRWQSPVAHMCRTAMADVEIGGQQIRKMDKLAIWYLSGNRDDSRFQTRTD